MKNSKQLFQILLLLKLSGLVSCRQEGSVKTELDFRRFEKDVFAPAESPFSLLDTLRKTYGSFADLYLKQIAGLRAENDTALAGNLWAYVNDKYIREVNEDVAEAFPDLTSLNEKLSEAFAIYRKHFPALTIPRIVTFTAPFSYNAVAADSVLGIGLDMYLGKDYPYYISAGFPLFKIKKLSREYMATDAMKAWLQSDYEGVMAANDLLNNMIYEGKLLYCMDVLFPREQDSIKSGYPQAGLAWCEDNEEKIWQFFIENKLLFNKNPGEYVKYINDGAGTGGFPAEAPARLGVYIGYRIVQSYMKKHEVSLNELMEIKDGNKILIESGYKPKK